LYSEREGVDLKARDAWYYTESGGREGPVSFKELKRMANEGEINPEKDKVWNKGLPQWTLSGQVKGLFTGKRKVAPKPKPKSKDLAPAPAAKRKNKKRSTASIGMRRRMFVPALIIIPAAWIYGMKVTSPHLIESFGEARWSEIEQIVPLMPLVIVLVMLMQRLANVGMNRLWVIGTLVPVVNLWLLQRCVAYPGDYVNRRKLDQSGKLMLIVYWCVAGLFLIVGGLLAAVALGWLGDADLQERVKGAFELRSILRRSPADPVE